MSKQLLSRDIEVVANKSFAFFLPMVGDNYTDLRNFKGAFVWNEDYPELDNHIFLLFKKSDSVEFTENQNWLKSFSHYSFSYEPDNFHIMLVYTPPTDYQTDYKLLKEGKYSRISDRLKRHIFKYFNIRNSTHSDSIYGILYRRKEYREFLEYKLDVKIPEDQELASCLTKERFYDGHKWIEGEMYREDMKVFTNIDNETLLN